MSIVQHSSSGACVHFLCSLATVPPNMDVASHATGKDTALKHCNAQFKRIARVRTRTHCQFSLKARNEMCLGKDRARADESERSGDEKVSGTLPV